MNAVQPDYVVFNGYANQYKDAPLTAEPGQRVRLWVLNAGPTTFSAFHVIGALFDAAYADGNPQNEQHGMQTVTIPPGGGYMVELTIPDAGLYPFVTHSFAYTGKGALGLIKVGDGGAANGANTNTVNMSH
jgi:nitrite reductase (NO-forming)